MFFLSFWRYITPGIDNVIKHARKNDCLERTLFLVSSSLAIDYERVTSAVVIEPDAPDFNQKLTI